MNHSGVYSIDMKRTLKTIAVVFTAVVLFTIVWTFAYPRLFPQRMLASQTKVQMVFLAAAASESYRFHNVWPTSIQQLVARPDPSGNITAFLKSGTNDAWGRSIAFEPFDPVRGYGRIVSYGIDGLPDGLGTTDDIVLNYGKNQKMTFAARRGEVTVPMRL